MAMIHARTDLADLPTDRTGRLGEVFSALAIHPAMPPFAPSLDPSSKARSPRPVRLGWTWWRAWREARLAAKARTRLAETSPHLLHDLGLTDRLPDAGPDRHVFGLRGDRF